MKASVAISKQKSTFSSDMSSANTCWVALAILAATGCLYRAASGSGAGLGRSLPKRLTAERRSRAASSPGAAFQRARAPSSSRCAGACPSLPTSPAAVGARAHPSGRPSLVAAPFRPPARGLRLTLQSYLVPAAPNGPPYTYPALSFFLHGASGLRARHRRGGGVGSTPSPRPAPTAFPTATANGRQGLTPPSA